MGLNFRKYFLMALRLACIFATFTGVFAAHPMPLHEQVINGTLAGVRMLIDRGENVNQCDALGMTPLHYAVREGKFGAVKLLIERGALVSFKDTLGMTPLHHAAEKGRSRVVKWLLEHGGAMRDVETRDNLNRTPLHYAAMSISCDTVRHLIEIGGAKINARDNIGKVPLDYARSSNVEDIQSYVNLQFLLSFAKFSVSTRTSTNADLKTSRLPSASVGSTKVDSESAKKTDLGARFFKAHARSDDVTIASTTVPKVCLKSDGATSANTTEPKVYLVPSEVIGVSFLSKPKVNVEIADMSGKSLPRSSLSSCGRISQRNYGFSGSFSYRSTQKMLDEFLDDSDYPYGWEYYASFYPSLLKPEHRQLLFGEE